MSGTPDYQMENDSDFEDEPEMLNYQDTLKLFPAPVQVKTELLEAEIDNFVNVKLEPNAADDRLREEEYILGAEPSNDILTIMRNANGLGINEDFILSDSDETDIGSVDVATASNKDISSIVISNVKSVDAQDSLEDLLEDVNIDNFPIAGKLSNHSTSEKASPPKHIFQCGTCSFTAKIRFALARHEATHREEESEEAKKKNNNNIKNTATEKLEVKEKPGKLFKCSKCPFSSKFRIALQKHDCNFSKVKAKENHSDNTNTNSTFKCKLCPFIGLTYRSIQSHQKVHNSVKTTKKSIKSKALPPLSLNLFRCNNCPLVAKSKAGLASHINHMHSQNRPKVKLICKVCHFKTTQKSVYLRHMEGHKKAIPKGGYKCNLCSFVGKGNASLAKHTTTHTNNMPIIQCQQCSYCSTEHSLHAHYLKVHTKLASKRDENKDEKVPKKEEYTTEESSGPQKCEHCSYESRHYNALHLHKKLHQKNSEILSCKYCKFKSTKVALTRHISNVHRDHKENNKYIPAVTKNKEPIKDERPEHKCKYCSYTTEDEMSLNAHLLAHTKHKQPVYSCTECGFKSTVMELSKHMMAMHKNIVSEEAGPQEQDATNVVNCNVNNFVFVCEICNYITNEKTALLVHKRAHQPQVVPEAVAAPPTLVKAKEEASKRKSIDKDGGFQCTECRRTFSNRGGFVIHRCQVASHQCTKCYFSTNSNFKLKFHYRTKHGVVAKTVEKKQPPSEKVLHINIDEVRLYKNKNYNVNIASPNENNENSKFTCSHCDYISTSLIGLKIHSRRMHRKEIIHAKGLTFECDRCPYVSQNVYHFTRHKKSCHGIDQHLDEARKQALKRTSGLKKGNGKAEQQEFSCGECNYKTNIRFKLKRHKLKHLKENKLKVQVEAKETKSPAKDVAQVHLKCIACYYVGKNKQALEKHYNLCHIEHE